MAHIKCQALMVVIALLAAALILQPATADELRNVKRHATKDRKLLALNSNLGSSRKLLGAQDLWEPNDLAYVRIYVRNLCSETARFVVNYDNAGRYDAPNWVYSDWVSVKFGEDKYLASTYNRNVYFYAESASHRWDYNDDQSGKGSRQECETHKGKYMCLTHRDVGADPVDFTYEVVCSASG